MNKSQIVEVKPLKDYKLCLVYTSSEKRVFDVLPYIKGNWYGELKDISYFNSVHISGDTVAWADGQDLAPHELYDNSVVIK